VLVVKTPCHRDGRGFFREWWTPDVLEAVALSGVPQCNHAHSIRHVLRGLHYQHPHAQGKLVTAIRGTIFDVVVDVRHGSPRFGAWCSVELRDDSGESVWIPPGFAHGYCVLSDEADVVYACSAPYTPLAERSVRWSDPQIGITWPVDAPVLSEKDRRAPMLSDSLAFLPPFA
jgi:dTDP-4-dehydrorhamnose 3,5-epimerase